MFVEFSVENFRSIGERITFSSVASSAASKHGEYSFPTGNKLAPSVLRSGVILGPNASGKSSIIKALKFFQSFVTTSLQFVEADDEINIPTNKIEDRFDGKDTEFEIIFIHDDELFQYGFRMNSKLIHEEWLFARHSKPGSKTRTLFQRSLVPGQDKEYSWEINEGQVPGEREAWKNATRPNALFLPVAVQLNSEVLKKPFQWIKNCLHIIGANQRISHEFTSKLLKDENLQKKVESIIKALDLHIESFDVQTAPASIPEEFDELLAPSLIRKMQEQIKDETEYKVEAVHLNDVGERVRFELDQESDGTQAIFGLAGPIFDVLMHGETLFIDELSNSLHPLALRAIVGVFNDELINAKGGQLFFTSHETSIISKGFMHKDQIWFVDRPNGFSTTLTAMSDFKVRDLDAFQRSYLGGKFGALPNTGGVKHAFQK